MSIDIILYAIIAAVLLFRLWSLLGQRSDEDQDRPNPFAVPKAPDTQKTTSTDTALVTDSHLTEALKILAPAMIPPASLAGGLEKIRQLDVQFDEKKFLQGARQAFAMILANFADDNLDALHGLLGDKVASIFQAAVAARQQAGQKMNSQIHRIVDVEITAARVVDRQAFVTVRFVSQQENILRDAGGQVVGGTVGQSEEVTDIWTFSRDTASGNPNWILVETRG